MNAKSIVIIGAGPGGEAAAKRLAESGAQVTLVERAALGGLCLNWGCIPTKVLLEGRSALSPYANRVRTWMRVSSVRLKLGETSDEEAVRC
jgi:dihydrolipoamide dehydrogenase